MEKSMFFTRNTKKLSKERCEEWRKVVFSFSWKVWLLTFVAALFLFIFFQPNEQCSREEYFYLFVVKPTVAEGLLVLVFSFIFKRLVKTRSLRMMSIATIIDMSLFAGITVCVHTSVSFIPVVLLFPMMLTPLYREKIMTVLQLLVTLLIYIADRVYFIPNSPYMPPGSSLIDITIFIASSLATFLLMDNVNGSFVLQDERSSRDSLTHLYNHETFYEELEYYMQSYDEKKETFSVLIADIDNFKKVNDTYGHAFGDEVIRQVVGAIERSRDKNHFCARYGGEEFAMILPGKNLEEAGKVGECIRKEFENLKFNTEEGERHFTLSIGVAEYTKQHERASQFFEEADKALYCAKESGKNRVCYAGRGTESEK